MLRKRTGTVSALALRLLALALSVAPAPKLPHPTTLETVWEHPNPSGPLCQQAGPFPRPSPPKPKCPGGVVSLAAKCS